MSVVGEEKALAPEGKAGGEMLKRGGDWQSVEDLAIIIGVGCSQELICDTYNENVRFWTL